MHMSSSSGEENSSSAPWRKGNPSPSVSLVAVSVKPNNNLQNGNSKTEVAKSLQIEDRDDRGRPGLLVVDTSLCQDRTSER